METEQQRDDEQPQGAAQDDESVEEFKEEMEEDPSRAQSPDDDVEQLRGG